jgi:hypothetical protein
LELKVRGKQVGLELALDLNGMQVSLRKRGNFRSLRGAMRR